MDKAIGEIRHALQDLLMINPRLGLTTTIAEMVQIFQRKFIIGRDFVYGEHCSSISVGRNGHATIDKGVYVDLEHGRVKMSVYVHEIDCAIDVRVDMIHIDDVCHMETDEGWDVVRTLEDVARKNWYSCSNNNYCLGPKSSALLAAIQNETGATPEHVHHGRPIPEGSTINDDDMKQYI